MKTLIINGIATMHKVRNAEDAVYGSATEGLFEHGEITSVNDAFDNKVLIEITIPREYWDLYASKLQACCISRDGE